MQTNGFFTRTTVPKSQLLLPFPNLGGLNERTNDGRVRHHALELSLTRRFSKGLSLDANYTGTRNEATTFLNDFARERTWLPSNLSRPHRVTVSGIYELPFGKGKPFLEGGFLSKIVGGWQVAATYEWQPGPLIGFGNLLYYGDQKTLEKDIKP
jgi:outer membrane receptor protein involved in Fe transport